MQKNMRRHNDKHGLPRQIPSESRNNSPACEPWTPAFYTSFKLILSARLCAAVWSNISDCDETYNYWEPTHFLMYGKGMQTWEYSPMYAIRSYAYLWLHVLPGLVYSNLLQNQRMLVFYFMRCVMAFVCSGCEIYFYKGIKRRYGSHASRLYLLLTIFNTGMFISSVAFLPSSFSMYMTLAAYGAWFCDELGIAVIATACSAILGWPFAGILGLPIALDCLFRTQKLRSFIGWCVVSVVIIVPPMVIIDTYYYGKPVFAALNIVLYNIFTSHGPTLYGVEPWHFYFKNGLLNFNVAFPLICAIPFVVVLAKVARYPAGNIRILDLSGMFIWCLIFFTQPHKEERFLFPVYPLFLLASVLCLDFLQRFIHKTLFYRRAKDYVESTNILWTGFVLLFAMLSISRTVLLYKAYSAPMSIAMDLGPQANPDGLNKRLSLTQTVNVCVGKEWYRWPSSFFLPDDWELQFLKSEFRGQLPKPFESGVLSTRIIPSDMNDQNLEEPSRYTSLSKCHFILDLDTGAATQREPNFSRHPQFEVVRSMAFLDAVKSPQWTRLFYIPYIFETKGVFGTYYLLRRKDFDIRKLIRE